MAAQQTFKFLLVNEELKKLINGTDESKHWLLALSVDENSVVSISVEAIEGTGRQVSAIPIPPNKVP